MSENASRDCQGSQYKVESYLVKTCFTLALILFLLFTFTTTSLAAYNTNIIKLRFTEKHLLVGPKEYYLALGDSLAFSYQPDFNFDDGYTDDFFKNLKSHNVKIMANLSCYGESSSTFITGNCPVPFLRKYAYVGSQLAAALAYLHLHQGQVSPVTLDIGANDVLPNIDTQTCTINPNFQAELHTLDVNLTQTILPQLHAALIVNGQVTSDLIMMNYYDPYQNFCPNTVPYVQLLNQHLADDIKGYGVIVNVFDAFGGSKVPNKHICTYTWMCSILADYHPTDEGYSTIATNLANYIGY